eukprot:TRINITY_DN5145_c0_g1_i2.p1 TRINITY_DN5145_c0_g1~~TRINITY_DN5145_c0_g1_i2.p1  ORF type:complete len:221 (-),score=49.50 TRINITY_DN5145_c0_g1_i2:683-1300(-)
MIGVIILSIILLFIIYKIISQHQLLNKSGFPSYSPIPILGASLEFKKEAPKLIMKLRSKFDYVKLNLAGLHLNIILKDKVQEKKFLTSKTIDSYSALENFGFGVTLGELNLFKGARLHTEILRKLSLGQFKKDFEEIFKGEWTETTKKDQIELYSFIRLSVLKGCVKYFIGEKLLEEFPKFVESYLDFQLTHEKAISLYMLIGQK